MLDLRFLRSHGESPLRDPFHTLLICDCEIPSHSGIHDIVAKICLQLTLSLLQCIEFLCLVTGEANATEPTVIELLVDGALLGSG